MRLSPVAVATVVLSLGLASCSGGGGAPRITPAGPTASPTASAPSGPNSASIAFRIAVPKQGPAAAARSAHVRKPSYVGPTTQSITIAIAYPDATFPTITATKSCDASGQNCVFSASTSLPVEPNAYTFTFTATGKNGANDVLSTGAVTQTLVDGPNTVEATLNALVASMSFSIAGTPVAGGTASQVFPVTFQAYDGDGNPVTGSAPYASPFVVDYLEPDGTGAFSLEPGATGSVSCNASSSQCSVTSSADTLQVAFNATANGFPSDPSYFPAEFVIYDNAASILTAQNSADIATAPCTTPQPICVYAPSYYKALLAAGGNGATFFPFSPTFVVANGSTIWTDLAVISTSGTQPVYTPYPGSLGSQIIAGLTYVPATGTAFAPDYTGNGTQSSQLLDSISASGAVTTTSYPTDTNTLFGVPSGTGIIVGPDGNVWWIDPVTGVLRYTNPSSPTGASSCVLQSNGQTFLTAAEIVPTPPGVTPSRIWFSAIDAINTESYLGYVNVSAGSNSCGAGQAGHYTAFDTADAGTPTPPNGLAVDGSGNAWYNEGDDLSFSLTNIGEATVNASTGAVQIPFSRALPGTFQNASQAWGLVYDQKDGNMYFAADSGVIGRFSPAAGIGTATAFALPATLGSSFIDVTSGPETDDDECDNTVSVNAPGPCVSQFAWDPGTSAAGRLTFVVPAVNSAISSPFITNVAVQLDLSGVTFGKAARGHVPARRAHRHRARHGERFGLATARPR